LAADADHEYAMIDATVVQPVIGHLILLDGRSDRRCGRITKFVELGNLPVTRCELERCARDLDVACGGEHVICIIDGKAQSVLAIGGDDIGNVIAIDVTDTDDGCGALGLGELVTDPLIVGGSPRIAVVGTKYGIECGKRLG
jgi:hypothetical protein